MYITTTGGGWGMLMTTSAGRSCRHCHPNSSKTAQWLRQWRLVKRMWCEARVGWWWWVHLIRGKPPRGASESEEQFFVFHYKQLVDSPVSLPPGSERPGPLKVFRSAWRDHEVHWGCVGDGRRGKLERTEACNIIKANNSRLVTWTHETTYTDTALSVAAETIIPHQQSSNYYTLITYLQHTKVN